MLGGCVCPRTGLLSTPKTPCFWLSGLVVRLSISWEVNFGQQVPLLVVLVKKRLWHRLYLCGMESGATNKQAPVPGKFIILLLSTRTKTLSGSVSPTQHTCASRLVQTQRVAIFV